MEKQNKDSSEKSDDLKTLTGQAMQESEHWHEIYRSKSLLKRRQKTHPRKLKKLGLFELSKETKILDVCCGTGEMLDVLAEKGFKNLTGVDLEVVSPDISKPWQFRQGSATQLPIESESMDVIYCAHSLHHLGSMKAIEDFMLEALRCLKPGGRLGIIDHYDSLQLRAAYGFLQLPIANAFELTRDTHRQLLEELTYMYDYLNSWVKLEKILSTSPFNNARLQKGLFFFYWTGFKK